MKQKPINDGGPAYPQPATNEGHAVNTPYGIAGGGMTLRDYFAGQALAGDFSAQNESAGCISNNFDDKLIANRVSLFYRFADAMLAEREKAFLRTLELWED